MRAEELLDAMGELPEDLLAPVEALRKKKHVSMVRWISLAAACLLICIIPFALPQVRGSTESAKGDLAYSNQAAAPEYGNLLDDAAETMESGETFRAEVLEIGENWIMVKPLPGEAEIKSSDKIVVSLGAISIRPEIRLGDLVEITYSGMLQETYPAGAVGVTAVRVVE